MKSLRRPAFASALLLMAALGVAPPAYAGTVGPLACGYGGYVSGATQADGQKTYLSGGSGHCGTLGLRVQYSHVGGVSWTAWKYSAYGAGHVSNNVGNSALKSEHTTSVSSLRWESFR